jgi:hypothetical protein
VVKEERRCLCCGGAFRPRAQTPKQRYCSQRRCQQARKRAWQKAKRESDPDYRENQRRAQQRWAARHPEYWRAWRQKHPNYTARQRQGERSARRNGRERDVPAQEIAKMDVWTPEKGLLPGTYEVTAWAGSEDCKDGRVKPNNLFIINPVDALTECLQREDLIALAASAR